MTLAAQAPDELPRVRMTPGAWAAVVTMLTGLACLSLGGALPWLQTWPVGWQLPATDWVGAAVEAGLGWIKPGARAVSGQLGHVMEAVNWLLVGTPAPLFIGLVAALGWRLGGARMAALAILSLGFVLGSGYWSEGMNTLALVAVSVPLALAAGLAIGLLAVEVPRLRGIVQGTLDVMQTVPTFAYLTPLLLLFGFGPVVGLIASAIYAAPPMARNVILGLERTDPEMREAARMTGASRFQQLWQVEVPAAAPQIMVGVNQCLMAALSMVIIAAVIGGFQDIGWEVLLTMRKALFGQSLMAGLVIVAFAVLIDRMSGTLAEERAEGAARPGWGVAAALAALGLGLSLLAHGLGWQVRAGALMPVADAVDGALGRFTAANGAGLEALKNGAMFYVLLPLRIGLDEAILPFTWGFQWTVTMSFMWYVLALILALAMAVTGRLTAGLVLAVLMGVLETGVAQLPWPFVLVGAGALAHVAGGARLAALCTALLATVLVSGLWDRALLSLYLCGAAVLACAGVGGALGLWAAVSPMAWRVLRPVCDMLQTIPLFVFLIPVLMFFQIGEFSAFLAICAYAVVPMIRYTRAGLTATPPEMIEAALAAGATRGQILRDVRAPYAAPTILLGLNQTILYAFSMLVIAALIGTTGLGQSIYLALGQADVGLGVSAGAAMAILAFVADRIVQGFAEDRRRALGL